MVLDNASDGYMIADAEGYVLYHNRAYMEVVNGGTEELTGHNMREYIERGDIKRSSALMSIEQRKEVRLHTYNNTYGKSFFVSSAPLFDGNNNIYRVITHAWESNGASDLKSQIRFWESDAEGASKNANRYPPPPEVEDHSDYGQGIIVASQKMKDIFSLAKQIKDVGSTVLLLGESGVGKDVIAQYIHHNGILRDKPYIAINCNALPEQLLESELFGYVGGSFTGANKEGKKGLFEAAKDGILFMDEIGDTSLSFQTKLLRVLETRSITRVGDYKPVPVNVRIIAATNKNLEELVYANAFREDLYYRLNVVSIYIPALRNRQDDILPLSLYYLHYYNNLYNLKKRFGKTVVPALQKYRWHGNIRELKNVVERLVVTSKTDVIQISDLNFAGAGASAQTNEDEINEGFFVSIDKLIPLDTAVERVEQALLTMAKDELRTNRRIAQKLNVSHATVCRKLRKYNII
jgi:TyrR family helix-turn-helix protein/PAS domain S-box-containing protein